ncbi:tRNA dimethylallyltransferase [Azospirillaceae bacterium]
MILDSRTADKIRNFMSPLASEMDVTESLRIFSLIVAGPTASGKSGLALTLAEQLNGAIINADSMQVYRELTTLTARPSRDDERRRPHRLYGVLSAAEPCSAALWRERAVAEIRAAAAEGLLPIIVGGTGLYIKALVEGLSPIPEIPTSIRAAVRVRMENSGPETLHAELAKHDPTTAARLRPQDPQRLTRAWEVLEASGRSLTEWQALPPSGAPPDMSFAMIALSPPRERLYAACDGRFRQMIARGALEEARTLMESELDRSLPIFKALGLPELMRTLEGELDLETAVTLAQTTTRHYAKRQATWFRHQTPKHDIPVLTLSE